MCARGDGIRGSKDPRAEIGKYPNSTNERKKMSKKTLKQRIALVAASALTAGFFSVVSTPAANAGNLAAGLYNWGTAAGTAYSSTTGGFCYQNNDDDILVVTHPSTATGSAITLFAGTANEDLLTTEYVIFSASGNGYFTTATAAATASEGAITKSADEKTLTIGDTGTSAQAASDLPDSVGWRQSGLGTTTINIISVVKSTGVQTVVETYTLSAVASCAAGVYSSVYSGTSLRTASTALTATTYDDGDDSGAVSVENSSGVAYLGHWLRDGLGAAVTDTASFLNVTTTGGCTISGTVTDLSSTLTSIVVTSGITNKVVKLFTSGANQNSCTVKSSYNGTEVSSKNLTFKGDHKSVVMVAKDAAIGTATGTGAGYYDVLDDKGSRIGGVTNATAVELTGSLVGASISFGTSTSSSTQGAVTIDAVDTARGAGTFKIRTTNNAGAFVLSPAISMIVSGGIATYSISLDKATYSPGEIITITISAKDSLGAIVPDGTQLAASAAGLDFAMAGSSNLSAAPTNTDGADAGSWKYKYTAGTVEGTWAANLGLSGVVTDTAKQLTYTIKSTSGAISNADVLKSIVSLIASINKQIQALQKLILKR